MSRDIIRRLDLQVTSYLELRFNKNKSLEEIEAQEKISARLTETRDLWDLIQAPSSDNLNKNIIQKFVIVACLLYIDDSDAEVGFLNLMWILECLEKRIMVPQYLNHDYCMLILDMRSLIVLHMNEDPLLEKDNLRDFFLAPLPADTLIRLTTKQTIDFAEKLHSLLEKLIEKAPKNWMSIGLTEALQNDAASIFQRLFEWNMEDSGELEKNAKIILPEKRVKNYAPSVGSVADFSSPKPVLADPSVPIFQQLVGKTTENASFTAIVDDFEDDYPSAPISTPSAAVLASPKQPKRKFNFDLESQSSPKNMSVSVGKRFLDPSLRKHAIETFRFRPLPSEVTSEYAVDWYNGKKKSHVSKAP